MIDCCPRGEERDAITVTGVVFVLMRCGMTSSCFYSSNDASTFLDEVTCVDFIVVASGMKLKIIVMSSARDFAPAKTRSINIRIDVTVGCLLVGR